MIRGWKTAPGGIVRFPYSSPIILRIIGAEEGKPEKGQKIRTNSAISPNFKIPRKLGYVVALSANLHSPYVWLLKIFTTTLYARAE